MAEIPKIGDTLLGKYRLDGVVGEGGMAIVYRAIDDGGRAVAVKVLRPQMLELPDIAARFDRETRAVSRLEGPHVARVFDVATTDSGMPCIVMELLDGHDLAEELDLRGPLPIDEAVDYVRQACTAMAEAHAIGIVHRDLKPSNLYLCDQGGTRTVKVLDFGISKVLGKEDDGRMTLADTSIGTPLYMSPEQLRSSRDVDHLTDVWSLGVILYELLAGRPPFAGSATAATAMIVAQDPEPVCALRPDVPAELDAVLGKALAKRAADRYADTSAFAAALLPFTSATPIAGARLEQIAREAASNRELRLAPSTTTSPTLIRPKRAVVAAIAAAAATKPASAAQPGLVWLLMGLIIGLPFAAAIAYFALR